MSYIEYYKKGNNISKVAYDLYKLHWISEHINSENLISMYRDYYVDLVDEPTTYSFIDYLEEFGFNGELYSCYNEFLDNEFQDIEYMKKLFGNSHNGKILYEQYKSTLIVIKGNGGNK